MLRKHSVFEIEKFVYQSFLIMFVCLKRVLTSLKLTFSVFESCSYIHAGSKYRHFAFGPYVNFYRIIFVGDSLLY